MISQFKKYRSINTQLKLLSIFSGVILLIAAAGLFVVLANVQHEIDMLVVEHFDEVLENSQNRADFGLIYARLSVFRASFYDNAQLIETEGGALKTLIEQLAARVTDSEQKDLFYRLRDEFATFLDRAAWINASNKLRQWQEEELSELLVFYNELQMSAEFSRDADTLTEEFRENSAHLRNLRLGFDKTLRLLRFEGRARLLSGSEKIALPSIFEMVQLSEVAHQLIANTPATNLLKRDLLTRLEYLNYLLQQYQLAMFRLGEQNNRLNELTDQIMAAMLVLDQRNSAIVAGVREKISIVLYAAFAGGLGMLILLGGVLLYSHRRLFQHDVVKPMKLVGQRLQAFRQGDHSTPMRLERSDEWERIESVFNDMLFSLEQSIASLRESDQRYREIFDNATEGIFRSSVDGRFLALNPAAVEMLGHASEAEAIDYYSDLSTQLYPDPQTRSRLLESLQRSAKNINFEAQVVRADGSLFWAAINNHLVYHTDGNILYIEGTVRDVSERKAAEESLHQLKNFLQRVIDSMPSVLIAVDPAGKIILWNRRAEQECRLRSNQAMGMELEKALKVVKYEVIASNLNEALTTLKPVRLQKVEGCAKAQGQTKRHYDMVIYPLPAEEDGGAVIHIDDVTEQVALEQILIQKEKMESLAGLAAGFAHELNNPLAVILQTVQVLQRRLSPEFSKNCEAADELGTSMTAIAGYLEAKKCDTMIASIAEAGSRAAKIVENIQTFSRPSGSDFSRYNLEDLVERTLDLAVSDHDMRRHLKFQRINIVRDYHSVPEVVCDSGQIQQVVLILLKNAAQALVKVDGDPRITLRLEAKGGYVCLEVRDNGTGMSPDVCRRVFDPFYSTQEVGQGVGLGLSIAYHIITQNHRGFMSVSSESGGGSSFELYLPTLSNI